MTPKEGCGNSRYLWPIRSAMFTSANDCWDWMNTKCLGRIGMGGLFYGMFFFCFMLLWSRSFCFFIHIFSSLELSVSWRGIFSCSNVFGFVGWVRA